MSSRPSEPRSIASQLVLLFTPAAALLLCCALGILYWIVVRHAFEEDNEFLADKILALRADLNRPDWPSSLEKELKTATAEPHAVYWIRLVDSTGHTLSETPGMSELLPSSIFAPAQKTRPIDYRTGAKLFSLGAIQANAGGQSYQIEIAQDRTSDEQFAQTFRLLLASVVACGIVASALIGITVTRRGLRPLSEMTRSVGRIGPTRLNERLDPARWPRELRPLAVAFDAMLDRLEDSFVRLSQFSADLAHELRTPVANILGESQVALTRTRPPEEYREVIESNVTECERLSGIIDSLLFLARAEAATEQISRTRFDGRPAIEKIANYFQTIAQDRHVAIVCAGAGEVYADPVLFSRAVSNLVENALRFTPDHGEISITIAARPNESEISVRDNGCGIAAEHLPRVFDRFYRADSSRSSQGTGLGLALVKSIVDLHGGSAVVKSEVNRGTTVSLIFPDQA